MSQVTSAGRMRRYATGLVAGVGLAGLMLTASSATLDTLEVSRSQGRYELRAETFLAAPAEEIYNVLLEYEDNKFRRISSVYKQSGYLDPDPDGTPLVYTRMEGCILFFCMDMKRVERLSTEAGRYIRTDTIPEESDFKYSHSEWVLEPAEGGTRMTYMLVMDPDFFVPPVVGPWLIKKALLTGGERAITRIERMARGEALPRRGRPPRPEDLQWDPRQERQERQASASVLADGEAAVALPGVAGLPPRHP